MHQDQNDMLVGQVCVTYSYNSWWTSRTLKSALAWVGFYANYDCEIGSQNHSNGLQYPIKDLPCLKHLSAYEPHFLSPCSCLCDPKPFKSSGQICHGEKVLKPSVLHPRNNSLKLISLLVSSQMGKIDLSSTLNLLNSQILINPHFIYIIYMLKSV